MLSGTVGFAVQADGSAGQVYAQGRDGSIWTATVAPNGNPLHWTSLGGFAYGGAGAAQVAG
jgi:hypothetical protein